MDSMITLGIEKLELDWGKYYVSRSHSGLFASSDFKKIPYYEDGAVEYKEGLSRKLKDMKRRLELQGYHLASLENLYKKQISVYPDIEGSLTYQEFFNVISNLNVPRIELDEELRENYDPGEFVSKYLFMQPEFNQIHNLRSLIGKDIGDISLFFEFLDPYITLRILAENPANAELDVYWCYANVLDDGWVDREEVLKGVGKGGEILIVTEGSSDTKILKKALKLLYPDIEDFFCFVDMEENYPFTGDGNLFNFCKGLSSIRIKNDILIIFDNDIAGVAKYTQSKKLDLPQNMHITKLPYSKDFKAFQTVGPNGFSIADINGSAVAIECFLDHTFETSKEPCVRWTSYNKEVDAYQGALIDKNSYTRKFMDIRMQNCGYDFEKIKFLIDHLYNYIINGLRAMPSKQDVVLH